MYDALAPALDALDAALAAGRPWPAALQEASVAAEAGRDATTPMLARKGRASYLGERSIGHQDPGATSVALLIAAAAATLGTARPPRPRGRPSDDAAERWGSARRRDRRRLAQPRAGRRPPSTWPRRCCTGPSRGSPSPPGWTRPRSAPTPSQIAAAIERGRRRRRRRRPDGPGQRRAQRRTGSRPAGRRRRPRPGAALPGAARRRSGGRRGRGGRGRRRGRRWRPRRRRRCWASPPTWRRTSVVTTAAARRPAPASTATFIVENPHGLHARPAARLVGEVRRLDAAVTLRNSTTGTGPVPAAQPQPRRDARRAARPRRGGGAPRAGRRRPRSTTSSHWPAGASTRPMTAAIGAPAAPPASPGTPLPRRSGHRRSDRRDRLAVAAVAVDDPPSRSAGRASGGGSSRPSRTCAGHRTAACRGGARRRRRRRPASSTPTSCCWTTPSWWARRGRASTAARRPPRPGPPPPPRSSGSGRPCPTPTCGPGPPTSAPWPTRCCVRSPAKRPSRSAATGVLVARDLTPAQAAALDPDTVTGRGAGRRQRHLARRASSSGRSASPPSSPRARRSWTFLRGRRWWSTGRSGAVARGPGGRRPRGVPARRSPGSRSAGRGTRPMPRARRSPRDGSRSRSTANLGSVADARAAARPAPTGPASSGPSSCSSTATTRPRSTSRRGSTAAMADAFGGRPITLRTMDVGGDKPLRYLRQAPEAEPVPRAARPAAVPGPARPVREQLDAICRVARSAPVKVMFPMVTSVDELLAARRLLAEAAGRQGLPRGLQVGMMVEVPAAALKHRGVPAPRGLREHRDQRPDAVHAGRGAGEPRRRLPGRPAGPGGAPAGRRGRTPRGGPGAGLGVRGGRLRRGRDPDPARARRTRAQRRPRRRSRRSRPRSARWTCDAVGSSRSGACTRGARPRCGSSSPRRSDRRPGRGAAVRPVRAAAGS